MILLLSFEKRMSLILIGIPVIYLLIAFDSKIKINNFNNRLLEQKEEIIRINDICQDLSIPYIETNIILISHKVINLIIILILGILSNVLILLFIYKETEEEYQNNLLIFIFFYIIIMNILLITIYIYLYKKYFIKIQEILNNIEEIINKKKNEINSNLIKKLIIIIDENDNIEIIDNGINDYLLKYEYLYNNNNTYNKIKLINDLKRILMNDKKDEFMNDMKNKLKDTILITPEIVKIELEEINEKLDNYENSLNSKFNQLILLSQVNSIIINID